MCAGHTVQPAAVVMPVALLELPLLQGVHDAEPVMEAYVPASHTLQVIEEASGAKEPSGQSLQLVLPGIAENAPRGQGKHWTAPESEVYEPAGQGWIWPVPTHIYPGGQGKRAVMVESSPVADALEKYPGSTGLGVAEPAVQYTDAVPQGNARAEVEAGGHQKPASQDPVQMADTVLARLPSP